MEAAGAYRAGRIARRNCCSCVILCPRNAITRLSFRVCLMASTKRPIAASLECLSEPLACRAFPKFIATLMLWNVDVVAARIKPRHPTAAVNAKILGHHCLAHCYLMAAFAFSASSGETS